MGSGVPYPSPEDLPDPGIEPGSPALQADALPSEPPVEGNSGFRESCNQGIKKNLGELKYLIIQNVQVMKVGDAVL